MTMARPTTTAGVVAGLSSPLPTDPRSVSRRRFLQAIALGAGSIAMAGLPSTDAMAAAPVGPGDGVLVLITMFGGNDGLSTVVPHGDGAYYDARRSLAIPAGTTHAIAGDRGLHPALGSMKSLWDAGHLAVIDGVGTPGPDLSHFTSMARWMSGLGNGAGFHSGWLGRYIDGLPGGDDPLHAVSIGSTVPLVVQGRQRRASGLPLDGSGIEVSNADATVGRQYAAMAALGAAPTGRGGLADALAGAGREAIALASTIEPVYGGGDDEPGLAAELDLCARLINANLGIRVLSVGYGDFDSHAGQEAMHGARMAELDAGVRAFFARLDPAFATRTLVLTASEFGRRVKANASGGTDHGTAGTMLAFGAGVAGGLYGQQPSLTQLDRQGNLVPTVDNRAVYATVLDRWLGADATEVLGSNHGDLGFVRSPGGPLPRSGPPLTAWSPTLRYRAQIVRLYKACFGRLPDGAGLDHWVDTRRGGTGLAEIAGALVASAEFTAVYGPLGDDAFIDRLYRNVLGRAPDAGGLAHWRSVLAGGGGRGSVVVGLSESAEFIAATAADVELVDESGPVARLYLAYFRRRADTDGLRYWLASNLSPTAVSDAFAASAEFEAAYGALDDAAFVDRVYQNVLGRPADADGRAHWLAALAGGSSRGGIMLAFSESDEFVVATGTRR